MKKPSKKRSARAGKKGKSGERGVSQPSDGLIRGIETFEAPAEAVNAARFEVAGATPVEWVPSKDVALIDCHATLVPAGYLGRDGDLDPERYRLEFVGKLQNLREDVEHAQIVMKLVFDYPDGRGAIEKSWRL